MVAEEASTQKVGNMSEVSQPIWAELSFELRLLCFCTLAQCSFIAKG